MEESILGICVKPNIFNSILIWGGGIFLGCEYKTQHFQFYPNIHAKHFGGENKYLWDVYKTQNCQLYPKICAKHLWGGNIFLGCV